VVGGATVQAGGHQKGQWRVLGPPSALLIVYPRALGGGGGGESADPISPPESPLICTWGY
jgi:hypothetical protein